MLQRHKPLENDPYFPNSIYAYIAIVQRVPANSVPAVGKLSLHIPPPNKRIPPKADVSVPAQGDQAVRAGLTLS